jgi:hypothetical protein
MSPFPDQSIVIVALAALIVAIFFGFSSIPTERT